MNTIISIMKDFYNCSNLPIQAINKDLKEIHKIGLDTILHSIYLESSVLKDINKYDLNNEYLNLSYQNDINFLITPISKLDTNKGFYIIGPFKTIKSNNIDFINIPFKPSSCTKYLYTLLVNIHNDKFSKGRINLNFSSYVRKAVDYTIKNYDSDISIDFICKILNINKSYFCKIFKKETGHTFCSFLNIFRIEKSKELLKNTDMSLLDIAISVGFNSQNYYTMVFKKLTGQTPIQFRNM